MADNDYNMERDELERRRRENWEQAPESDEFDRDLDDEDTSA